MAARISAKHDEATREKIKTSQLINRLQAFALCEVVGDAPARPGVMMTAAQVRVALGLLRKTLPDLVSVEASGPGGGPVPFVIYGEREAADASAWQAQHAPTDPSLK